MNTEALNPNCNANQDFFEYPVRSLIFLLKKLKIRRLLERNIKDPRSTINRSYSLYSLIMRGLSIPLFRSCSKNDFSQNFKRFEAKKAFAKYASIDQESVPCTRSPDNLFLKINPDDFHNILPELFNHLRSKKLFQLHPELIPNGKYHFSIDAHQSHTYHENSQHPCQCCPYCLKRTRGNKTWYVHLEVIALFTAPNGLQIPVLCHRIRAKPEWGMLDEKRWKQECEQSAFPIVARKLRELFPRLNIFLLLDSLYATEPNFTLLEDLKMGYSIVKKTTVLTTVGSDCNGLKLLSNPVFRSSSKKHFDINQTIYIFNDVAYRGHNLNVIQLDEEAIKKNSKRFAKITSRNTHWEWIVSDRLTGKNVGAISDRLRLRWKEEDFFNTAERRGFYMNHDFCRAPTSQTIWFYLILLAMAICSILEHSTLNMIFKKTTISFVMRQMLNDLLYVKDYVLYECSFPKQLRFAAPFQPP
jgi:hypothetical protein